MPHSPAVPDAIAALVSPLATSETDGTVTAAPEQDGHGFPTPPATQPVRPRAAILRDLTSPAPGAERAAAETGVRRARRRCGSTSAASPGSQRSAREEPRAVVSRVAAAARRAANEARSLPGTRVAVVPAAVDHRLTEAIKYFLQGMGYTGEVNPRRRSPLRAMDPSLFPAHFAKKTPEKITITEPLLLLILSTFCTLRFPFTFKEDNKHSKAPIVQATMKDHV
ncbi:uncharacterized protein LOC130581983 [Malurus melanocephalus]|uniref:uncharacterized protein LOC130581983 n=1 Tax=Malurus melanocephalus TaxID=175006 RepID=UPI002547176E|nr:uncharacterized protein LOC130581983 [Malurus melanocephalus]